MTIRSDTRTNLPERQYIAGFSAPWHRPLTVRVVGAATDLVNREAVSTEAEEYTGHVPEFVAQIAMAQTADTELVVS